MKLFSKEKDIIHRIVNLIFVVWFIAAVVILYISMVNLFMQEPIKDYETYKTTSCTGMTDDNCNTSYLNTQYNRKLDDYYRKVASINAFGNMVIVGIAAYIINHEKKEIKKSNKKKK